MGTEQRTGWCRDICLLKYTCRIPRYYFDGSNKPAEKKQNAELHSVLFRLTPFHRFLFFFCNINFRFLVYVFRSLNSLPVMNIFPFLPLTLFSSPIIQYSWSFFTKACYIYEWLKVPLLNEAIREIKPFYITSAPLL